jgi:ribonuclease D
MAIKVHSGDLPAHVDFGPAVAIDTETLGLDVRRDRLCVVQLSGGDGSAEIVQISPGQTRAPNLERLLSDRDVVKLFHFGRFDMAVLRHAFGIMPEPIYCTKIASKLART